MPRLTREKKQVIQAALKAGETPTAVSKAHGLSRSSIYRIIAESGRGRARSPAPSQASGTDSGNDDTEDADDEDEDEDADEGPVASFKRNAAGFANELGLEADQADEEEAPGPARGGARNPPAAQGIDPIMAQVLETRSPQPRLTHVRDEVPEHILSRYASLEEPGIDRAHVIQKLMWNVETFEAVLKPAIGGDPAEFVRALSSKTDRELASLLDLVERTRSVGNLAQSFRHTFYAAATGAEFVTKTLLGMKTDGFVAALQQQNDEITSCLKELAIDRYAAFNAMNRPELRLGLIAVLTLVQVDSTARLNSAVARASPAVNAATESKYGDL